MLDSLLHEIEFQKDFFEDKKIESIYFGGGTPSILAASEVADLLNKIRKTFNVSENIECTLEANPDDITSDKIREWQSAGINRLSIGIQSFYDEDLQYMNRSHDAAQAEKCIQFALENGMNNFSVDLIFGYPLLTNEKWKSNIEKILQYPIPHVSCYGMTVEPKTALANMIAKNKLQALDDETGAAQYTYLMNRLMEAGYEHYEISNFAKKGFEAKHNSSYWKNEPYLGIGPSAHSYDGNARRWNVANNAIYMDQISKNIIPCEEEILTRNEKINERIMISLRTSKGLHLNDFKNMLNESENNILSEKLAEFIKEGMIILAEDSYKLTQKGKLFADGIASELFVN